MKAATRKKLSWITLVIGLCFIGMGIHRDEVNTVFNKVVHICLECVGIG